MICLYNRPGIDLDSIFLQEKAKHPKDMLKEVLQYDAEKLDKIDKDNLLKILTTLPKNEVQSFIDDILIQNPSSDLSKRFWKPEGLTSCDLKHGRLKQLYEYNLTSDKVFTPSDATLPSSHAKISSNTTTSSDTTNSSNTTASSNTTTSSTTSAPATATFFKDTSSTASSVNTLLSSSSQQQNAFELFKCIRQAEEYLAQKQYDKGIIETVKASGLLQALMQELMPTLGHVEPDVILQTLHQKFARDGKTLPNPDSMLIQILKNYNEIQLKQIKKENLVDALKTIPKDQANIYLKQIIEDHPNHEQEPQKQTALSKRLWDQEGFIPCSLSRGKLKILSDYYHVPSQSQSENDVSKSFDPYNQL